jgi:hypothetical protein
MFTILSLRLGIYLDKEEKVHTPGTHWVLGAFSGMLDGLIMGAILF